MSEKVKEQFEEALQKVKDLTKVCPMPPELTFRGVRKRVMNTVWEKADEIEKKGIPLLTSDFGRIVQETWTEAKKEWIPAAAKRYEACVARAGVAARKPELEKVAAEIAEEQKDNLVELGVSLEEPEPTEES